MKRDTLTETERRIVAAWKAAGLPDSVDLNDPASIRAEIRRTAYHEAGHVAARVFTGQEAGHIVHVSIIPDAETLGHERSERNVAEAMLCEHVAGLKYPPHLERTEGRRLLLRLLAGRASACRLDPTKSTAAAGWKARLAESAILDMDADEWETEGTDLFRAWRVAAILAGPRWNTWRVLALAEKWTVEMLALPDVWRCVETLAGMLLERGTLEDRAEIMAACDGILYAGLKLPKWKRRLLPTKAEQKAMGLPTERVPKWKG